MIRELDLEPRGVLGGDTNSELGFRSELELEATDS